MKRTLGSSGILVNPIGLGGMPMSLAGRPPEEQSIATIHAALEAGVDFVDTADVYCVDDSDLGHNERLIAKALRGWRGHDVVVATKGGLERPGGQWTRNGRPEHLKLACDRSLAALGVGRIALYQLHAPDEEVRFEDSVGALAELRAAGKIAHVGLSNVTVDHIERARRIVPIVSVQNRCNVYDRRAFQDGVIAYCEANGLAFLPWSPVGGGRERDRLANDETLGRIADRHAVSRHRVALAWLLAKSRCIVPIPGASKPHHAADSAAAMHLELSAADVAEMDRTFPT